MVFCCAAYYGVCFALTKQKAFSKIILIKITSWTRAVNRTHKLTSVLILNSVPKIKFKMQSCNITGVLLFLLSAFIHGVHNLDYTDLQALGVACADHRDMCRGYMNNMSYTDRSCECDYACNSYKDCCIDASSRKPNRRISLANRMACMPYGAGSYQGVYVIVNCGRNWQGSSEIRQRCEGPQDHSDPLNAAPVTSVAQGVTYRNRFCAECNYANLPTLKTFEVKMECDGLAFLTAEQIFADLTYNPRIDMWGVNRMNTHGNATDFIGCAMIFDVPQYINTSVRFCRASVISSCPPDWTRQQVRKNCEDYMAVVYGNEDAYRNVHCAICNNMNVDQVSCGNDLASRKRPMSFALLLDVNQRDGDQVGMRRVTTPECPSNNKYDPFFKKCRQLVCALPNHVVRDGVCVRG